MHEFVAAGKRLKDATGIRAMDVAKRLIDLGYHPSTVYFPLVVDEAMMVEPTETETKETLEAFAQAMRQAAAEARSDPDLLHEAPVTTPVRRLDEARAARHLKLRWGSPDTRVMPSSRATLGTTPSRRVGTDGRIDRGGAHGDVSPEGLCPASKLAPQTRRGQQLSRAPATTAGAPNGEGRNSGAVRLFTTLHNVRYGR